MLTKISIVKNSAIFIIILVLIFLTYKYKPDFLTDLESLRTWVESFGFWAPVVVIGLYVFATLTLLPVSIIVLVSGVVFGIWLALLYTVIGAMLGALFAFYLARSSLFYRTLSVRLSQRYPKIKDYNQKINKHSFWIVASLRAVPFFSYGALSYLLGLTEIGFLSYLGGTFVAVVLGNFLFIYAGVALVELDFKQILIAAGLYLGFMIVTYIAYRYLEKVKNK
jgi:uncharacterized membrane protein YdjX (TVP38/TMEM64 family)